MWKGEKEDYLNPEQSKKKLFLKESEHLDSFKISHLKQSIF